MRPETNVTTLANLCISTSKCFSSFLNALSVTILLLSLTAPRLRRYPAGSSCGSGGRGRSILGSLTGDMGDMGVPGVLAAEVRLRKFRWAPAPGGDLRLEACELMLTLDGFVLIDGSTFGFFSLREKRPIVTVCWKRQGKLGEFLDGGVGF